MNIELAKLLLHHDMNTREGIMIDIENLKYNAALVGWGDEYLEHLEYLNEQLNGIDKAIVEVSSYVKGVNR